MHYICRSFWTNRSHTSPIMSSILLLARQFAGHCPANCLWANAYMASSRRCAGHDSVHPNCLLDVVQHIDTLIPCWPFSLEISHWFSWNFDYDFHVSSDTSFLLSYLVTIFLSFFGTKFTSSKTEPEWVPHACVVHEQCLYVCMLVELNIYTHTLLQTTWKFLVSNWNHSHHHW